MSLREEVKEIVHRMKYTCTIPNEDFDEIINLCMDAAIEAVNQLRDDDTYNQYTDDAEKKDRA